jgi:hypothetical protein
MNLLQSRYDLMVRILKGAPETAEMVYLDEQKKTLDRILSGERYLIATFYIPNEILSMFDMPVLFIERTAGFSVSCGAAGSFFKNGLPNRKFVLPASACSYQKLFGSLLCEGYLPVPAGFAASAFACDDAFLFCAAAAKKYNLPFYFIDIKRSSLGDCVIGTAQEFERFTQELKNDFSQIRSLAETMALSNTALAIKKGIDDLRLSVPGLLDSRDCLKLFPIYNDLGRSCAIKALSLMEKAAVQKAADYKQPRCKKILWCGLVPLYYNKLIFDIEQRYSCRIVFEELFDIGRPFSGNGYEALAERLADCVYFTPQNRQKLIFYCCSKAKIDGIICLSQRNCKFLDSLKLPILEYYYKNGIPFVELSCDVIDKTLFNEDKIFSTLDAFFEMEAFQ